MSAEDGVSIHRLEFEGRVCIVISHRLPTPPAKSDGTPCLTRAESRIAAMLRTGRTYREIGIARGISARTVANHAQSIYRKLGVQTREELVAK